MIKYLGSKRTLLPAIFEVVQSNPDTRSVIDLFSGTSRVGHSLKKAGLQVLANDHTHYAHTLAKCYVSADAEDVVQDAAVLVKELNLVRGAPGYFTETFCKESRFFTEENGARVDAIRARLETLNLEEPLRSVMLTSLMEAADRVDSTCGVQMAYLKSYAKRAKREIEMRVPDVLERAKAGKGSAACLDAYDAAQELSADVAYLDPPYNQHAYLGNYHVWETLVLNDQPTHYGVACKRVDVKERKSDFNSKRKFKESFAKLIDAVDANMLVVSFSNEGYLSVEDMMQVLSSRGDVEVYSLDYKRYVGAQIGIHNRNGERVGEVSHLRNRELIFRVASSKKMQNRLKKVSLPAMAAL
ncbi:MAG: DNA methyltransferase [Deltaproteobacteria bacterium]|nr:DNA methyltransferase [Deltaproteobacteria bacterium]